MPLRRRGNEERALLVNNQGCISVVAFVFVIPALLVAMLSTSSCAVRCCFMDVKVIMSLGLAPGLDSLTHVSVLHHTLLYEYRIGLRLTMITKRLLLLYW